MRDILVVMGVDILAASFRSDDTIQTEQNITPRLVKQHSTNNRPTRPRQSYRQIQCFILNLFKDTTVNVIIFICDVGVIFVTKDLNI
jgi:hypothetical protein